jgi:hypothetical protein
MPSASESCLNKGITSTFDLLCTKPQGVAGVDVANDVAVAVSVTAGPSVGVCVDVDVSVGALVSVTVGVDVSVGPGVGVALGVKVLVGVAVSVGGLVAEGV